MRFDIKARSRFFEPSSRSNFLFGHDLRASAFGVCQLREKRHPLCAAAALGPGWYSSGRHTPRSPAHGHRLAPGPPPSPRPLLPLFVLFGVQRRRRLPELAVARPGLPRFCVNSERPPSCDQPTEPETPNAKTAATSNARFALICFMTTSLSNPPIVILEFRA
jgi:hypothetical protein